MATSQTNPQTVTSPAIEVLVWTGMLTVSLLTSAILTLNLALDWGLPIGHTTEPIAVATVAVGLPVWVGVMFVREYDLLPF